MALLLCLYTCCCLFGTPGTSAKYGLASYYGADFHGKRTASGETFDQYKLTCAHRDLPFGTRLKVTNVENGKWVVVRVNDRGPWVAGRIIDLSYAAARKIDMVEAGIVDVKLEILK
jgi:rare lipoprotein A